jgi:hypothetical protein
VSKPLGEPRVDYVIFLGVFYGPAKGLVSPKTIFLTPTGPFLHWITKVDARLSLNVKDRLGAYWRLLMFQKAVFWKITSA